jgi:imidazolonepropionase-like amidohydrolase
VAPKARRVRTFRDATVLPGLVDLHVHGLGCGQIASPVTTVRDLASSMAALPVRLLPRAPRVIPAGPFITPPGGYPAPVFGSQLADVVRSPEAARAAVRAHVARGAGVIKVGMSTRYPNLSPEQLRAVVEAAHAARVRVTAHVESIAGVRAALAAGVDELAHTPYVDVDTTVMQEVAAAGLELVATLHVVSRVDRRVRARALANARAFVAAGGTLLYGSDFGVPGIPLGAVVEELRLMRQAGLSGLDVLRAATSRAGAVLPVANAGRLRPGAPADLAVVSGDATRDLSRLGTIPRFLVVRGQIVIDGPRLNGPVGAC